MLRQTGARAGAWARAAGRQAQGGERRTAARDMVVELLLFESRAGTHAEGPAGNIGGDMAQAEAAGQQAASGARCSCRAHGRANTALEGAWAVGMALLGGPAQACDRAAATGPSPAPRAGCWLGWARWPGTAGCRSCIARRHGHVEGSAIAAKSREYISPDRASGAFERERERPMGVT